jgi:hypothetical protein
VEKDATLASRPAAVLNVQPTFGLGHLGFLKQRPGLIRAQDLNNPVDLVDRHRQGFPSAAAICRATDLAVGVSWVGFASVILVSFRPYFLAHLTALGRPWPSAYRLIDIARFWLGERQIRGPVCTYCDGPHILSSKMSPNEG